MYINNTNEVVNPQEFVSNESVIAKIFEVYPQVVYTNILSCDFSNYINTIPEHCNSIILQGIECNLQHIIDLHFIEVVSHDSFDYEHFGFCGTHHETVSEGYVRRTPHTEDLACEGPWDDDYFW